MKKQVKSSVKKTKLPLKWGVSAGIVMGGFMLLTHVLNMFTGYGSKLMELLATLYPGYQPGVPGMCLVVGAYAFVDAGMLVFLVTWIAQKLKI